MQTQCKTNAAKNAQKTQKQVTKRSVGIHKNANNMGKHAKQMQKKGTNNATKMHQKSKPNANEKQNNCDQKRSVALYVRLVLFAILLLFFGKFCAFPWENAKFAAKNMPEKHRTNIAHKTHKHREKHTKKVVCKIWLCMCILCAFWSLLFCVV